MDDDKARILIRSLLDHPALEELDLSHNLIGDRGARAAAKLLSHSRLRVLNLANNQVRAPGAQSLAHALANNTCLVSLNLRLNLIEDEGGQAITHVLETNKCLTVLNLGGNELSEPTATLLSQVLPINTTLISLNLSCNHIGLVSHWGRWAWGGIQQPQAVAGKLFRADSAVCFMEKVSSSLVCPPVPTLSSRVHVFVVYMHVDMFLHVCGCTCMSMCACVWRPKVDVGNHPQ